MLSTILETIARTLRGENPTNAHARVELDYDPDGNHAATVWIDGPYTAASRAESENLGLEEASESGWEGYMDGKAVRVLFRRPPATATYLSPAPTGAPPLPSEWYGDARLYKLSEPIRFYNPYTDAEEFSDEVVVSAVRPLFQTEPETTILIPGRAVELPGSFRGALDHAQALRGLGFEIKENA